MKYIALLTLMLVTIDSVYSKQADSLSIEEVNGKPFIIHRVAERETLYSLSRRYDVSIYKIIENNPPTEFGLELGQTVRIPYIKIVSDEQSDLVIESKPDSSAQIITGYHTVAPGETLFAISRRYGIPIESLKKWNNLKENTISVGQRLVVNSEGNIKPITEDEKQEYPLHEGDLIHIVNQSETLYSISREYQVTVKELREWNSLTDNKISVDMKLIVGKRQDQANTSVIKEKPPSGANEEKQETEEKIINEKVASKVKKVEPERTTNFEEIQEDGLAAMIKDSQSTRKYLALHRSAKVGTIMRVRNEMNDQEVFVRVLGKLPDIGLNENVIIKISKSAYDRLGAIDPKFRVTISYIP